MSSRILFDMMLIVMGLMLIGVFGFVYVVWRSKGHDEQLYVFALVSANVCAAGATLSAMALLYAAMNP